MKLAREELGLTQAAFHEQFGYGSVRSYQKNEAGSNEAGICLAGVFARAGINANWLLTGAGPMLLDPTAELGRLLVEARGDLPIQRLAEEMEVTIVSLAMMERGGKIADAESIHDYGRLCGADRAALFAARDRALVAAGLLAAPTKPEEPAPAQAAPLINVDALSSALVAMQQTAKPGETPAATVRKAVEFYVYCLEKGLITPEGEGPGLSETAA